MKPVFVDTNLFIRYLTNDDPAKADQVEALLARAEQGDVHLVTADLVVAEIVWVLESAYGMGAAEIAPMLRAILATPGLRVIGAPLVSRALELYESHNVDFVDAHIVVAVMEKEGIGEIFTFDRKHMARFPGIARRTP